MAKQPKLEEYKSRANSIIALLKADPKVQPNISGVEQI